MAIDYSALDAGRTWEQLLPSAARIATPNQQQLDVKVTSVDGAFFVVNATAVAAAGSVTAKVEGVDPLSQGTWPILTASTTAVINNANGAGTYVFKVHPSTPSATVGKVQHAQDVAPTLLRFTLTHADSTNSFTYSVSVMVDGD